MKQKKLIIVYCVIAVLLGIGILWERNTLSSTIIVYTVEWDGNRLYGTYEGEKINNVPEGIGTFRAEDGTMSYEGEWADGEFSGNGTIVYGDGSVETGVYRKGTRNGEITVEYEDGTYRVSQYSKGVPYGKCNTYKGEKKIDSDVYTGGSLTKDILENAVELNKSSVKDLKAGEEYVYVSGTVTFVADTEDSCYFRISTDSAGTIIGNYINNTQNRSKQVCIPNLALGDKITLYGYYNGIVTNEVITDKNGYGYDYISILPLYGELDNNAEKNKKDYQHIEKNPFLYVNDKCKGSFEIEQIISKNDSKYLLVHEQGNLGHKLYLLCEDFEKYNLMTGMTIEITGNYKGQFKKIETDEVEQYRINQIESNIDISKTDIDLENDIIRTYNYQKYPLVKIAQLEQK